MCLYESKLYYKYHDAGWNTWLHYKQKMSLYIILFTHTISNIYTKIFRIINLLHQRKKLIAICYRLAITCSSSLLCSVLILVVNYNWKRTLNQNVKCEEEKIFKSSNYGKSGFGWSSNCREQQCYEMSILSHKKVSTNCIIIVLNFICFSNSMK